MASVHGDSSSARQASRFQRRAAEACSFCRRRKIKCNNARPVCTNCTLYAQECAYEPISPVAKEAGRERHLVGKRRRAHDRNPSEASRQTRSPAPAQHEGDAPNTLAGDQQTPREAQTPRADAARQDDARVARILVSANGVSSYHGRTSALFEDNAPERSTGGEHRPRMPDDWVERGLPLAQDSLTLTAADQMEELNFRRGKLDFDGVDPDLAMHLLSLHWNRQHHSFLLTHRPAFMRDMACQGPYFSKLLLNAIYFGASKFSPRLEVRRDAADVRTAGWRFRERVRELLGGSLDRSDVTTIQALLVMTNSLFALGDERSAAWLYSGLAFRMLIDLGMHVDLSTTRRFSDEDLEIRRRVFWGAFVVDKVQSLYQGRPVSLKECDALVPIKFLDSYEELEHWQPFAYSTSAPDYPGSPAYSTSTFTFLCKLSLVMSDILSCIYTERSFDQSPAQLASMLEKLQQKLCAWQESLPGHLHFDPTKLQGTAFPPPHVFSLHAMYHVLVILLHRPFVADGHLYSTSRSISVDSFMKCASAASSIVHLLRAYHRAFSIRRAPYLISYATYVAATIHSRIAARRGHDSTAYGNLATCLAVFKENQETNSAVQKATMIVQSLMKKLSVVIEDISSEALEMDQTGKSRNAERPATEANVEPERRSEPTRRTRSSTYNSAPRAEESVPTATHSGTGYSPGSEWVDIDGIIQSFLQENDAGAPNQLPNPPWIAQEAAPVGMARPELAQYGAAQGLAPTAVPPPEAAYNTGYSWQQDWRPANNDSESLEDPLFGFNGSSLGNLAFMSW
ncbi:Nitrogen assimilation transcription factor nirA [Tolypocladium ophioglossoides CBS 100239]|uniref:Nitrogen assimilation transcription factor nirA n=1 Tax=Tolypocladium ophioglossoides (strain CBS 100239) TaxID=1163406 RepID=A0A0L0N5Y1_TOLOC|nr:Nitrogen assimilation transcription factor nirA [Tolypocladium ophioglossoides CBS 100239]